MSLFPPSAQNMPSVDRDNGDAGGVPERATALGDALGDLRGDNVATLVGDGDALRLTSLAAGPDDFLLPSPGRRGCCSGGVAGEYSMLGSRDKF